MAGLEAWDTAGRQILDMTANISQMQGFITTGGVNGSTAIPAPPGCKERFFIVVPLVDLQMEKGKRPGVVATDTNLSWAYSYATNGWGYFSANCRIYYGYH